MKRLLLCVVLMMGMVYAQAPNPGKVLGQVQVRQITFQNAQVADVIDQIAIMARELDPPVNIVLENPDLQRPPINLDLRDQSLRQILLLVCKVSGLQIEVRNGIVFIVEPKE